MLLPASSRFVLPGRRRASAAGITLTAGSNSGLEGYGRAGGYFEVNFGVGAFGSISGEPVIGQTFDSLSTNAFPRASFVGNAEAALAGLKVYVNGVAYPFDDNDWTWDGDFTVGSWSSVIPVISSPNVYTIEVKA